jgi:hypothetical protein
MGNGQWAMGNGQWAMGNGQWAMGNGQWAMGNGQWAIYFSAHNFANETHLTSSLNWQNIYADSFAAAGCRAAKFCFFFKTPASRVIFFTLLHIRKHKSMLTIAENFVRTFSIWPRRGVCAKVFISFAD